MKFCQKSGVVEKSMSQDDHDAGPDLAKTRSGVMTGIADQKTGALPSPEAVRALLEFYTDWGVTCWLQDKPISHRVMTAIKSEKSTSAATSTRDRALPTTLREGKSNRETTVNSAPVEPHRIETPTQNGLINVETDATQHPALLALARTAMSVVSPVIVASSPLLILGEIPNADEDRSGIVFSGKTGELLDTMLVSIGMSRAEISLAPALPWRPPGGRHLTPAEAVPARAALHALIARIQPQQIVSMGTTPLQLIQTESTPLTSVRGKWQNIEIFGKSYALLPMRHPLQILTSSRARQDFWRDLLTLANSKK